jgi:hypothetical protein
MKLILMWLTLLFFFANAMDDAYRMRHDIRAYFQRRK